ncbi:hypothetical protein N0V95_001361 [Ascochyta clinopodiicola]|nr:hypothetical protein N0V95_001361 [Ascochyta clinopodiicola]
MLSQCTGKVGSRIIQKLEKLAQDLPDVWLRQRAQSTIDRLCMVDEHPVVLNHGDLIPSNILVRKETWEITGLVDWAEAEFLPFGTCLYGLEHLLGFFQPASQKSDRATFTYYENAPKLPLSQPSTELSCPTVTSSTTDRTSEGYSATIPDVNLPEKARVSTEQVMVALQKLITPGTSHNPIVLTENSPPPNNQVKTGHCMKIKAQMFQEKHSKSYTFESPYAALGPEYATGSTFTGHQSHDLYRMHTAKMAQPDRYLSKAPSSQRDILFEVQYPICSVLRATLFNVPTATY